MLRGLRGGHHRLLIALSHLLLPPHLGRHLRLPGDVSLGPVQITFLTGSPLTVNSSLQVPSLSVGLTYTKGSWWIVTIWGKGSPAWTTGPLLPRGIALSAHSPLGTAPNPHLPSPGGGRTPTWGLPTRFQDQSASS